MGRISSGKLARKGSSWGLNLRAVSVVVVGTETNPQSGHARSGFFCCRRVMESTLTQQLVHSNKQTD